VGGVSVRPRRASSAGAIEERRAAQMVERGRAGVMHAPGLLAHGDDAAAGGFVEVKWMWASLVRALRTWSSMAPWRDFAAFDVGDGNAQGERNRGGRQHLVAVGDEQQQIGPPGGERVGQAEDGHADGLGHAGVGVGAEQALDARLIGKPSRSISLIVLPNSGERCAPSAKTPSSTSGCAASSRRGQ
jgi:hypothetical protein